MSTILGTKLTLRRVLSSQQTLRQYTIDAYRNTFILTHIDNRLALFRQQAEGNLNYVNITAELGAEVMLDGLLVDASLYETIGSGGFGVARVELDSSGSGTHIAASSRPFGISVYGYQRHTSYWYPGGLSLGLID